ncbi:hypothetical protein [Muricoccus aerilatus]|uniref:hypothetical protein n=1 Tax=Muricoccus aerilatus TaxID=452982 RepID=UPI001B8071D6|nr:hypothetical protein [Roseomonas aerilata]
MLTRTEFCDIARFCDIASAYNFALMVPQSETERLLGAQLRSFGATAERMQHNPPQAEGSRLEAGPRLEVSTVRLLAAPLCF